MTQLALNFFAALAIGLLPSLIARYVVVRKPLKSASANWIAGISVIPIVLAYRAFSEVSETKFSALAGGVAVASFLLARIIMHRGYDEDLSARIRLKLDQPDLNEAERQTLHAALERLKK